MSPQMVCAIGVVELYLVRGEAIAAFLFFVMSFAPLAVVNEAFYRGLK
ncbi:unnamed protein product [Anisakis simplex]|uniref:Transmembrane protein n=1 Tax=Anisakis simplex TaxID=6269 RepID=A0A0M3JGZ6_ANISI|nr:unnamed protein product [Anisakis simplex]